MVKMINRIPGSPLLISSLPGSALRMHVESLGKPGDSTRVLEALPGKLNIKRHSPSNCQLLKTTDMFITTRQKLTFNCLKMMSHFKHKSM